ncbi:MAG: hypothetical protein AAGG81_00765 [Chlamydiota bacterium]
MHTLLSIVSYERETEDFAAKRYEISLMSEEDIEQEEEHEKDDTEQEAEISRSLSQLLFFADRDIDLASSCLETSDIKQCSEMLASTAHGEMEGVRERISQHEIGFYGYELCDTGLPEDFEYSSDIARGLKEESSHVHYKEFKKYPSEHDWKKIGKEQFQGFIKNIIRETVKHLQSEETGLNRRQAIDMWEKVGEQFCKQVNSHTFLTKITTNLFGRHYRNEQRKEFKVNEFTCQSTPWFLRWGGSPDEVIESLYSYKKNLVGMHQYTGTASSVLAWRINYCRKQPEFIKEQFSDPFYTTVVVTPPSRLSVSSRSTTISRSDQ